MRQIGKIKTSSTEVLVPSSISGMRYEPHQWYQQQQQKQQQEQQQKQQQFEKKNL